MSFTAEKPSQPLKKRSPSWSDLWLKNTKPLNHVLLTMQLQSLSSTKPPPPKPSKTLTPNSPNLTLLLSDDLLLQIFTKLPHSQRIPVSLVCKRWLKLLNRLINSLKLFNWEFLESGHLISRFPNLTHVDLLPGSVISSPNSGILVSHRFITMTMSSRFNPYSQICEENLFSSEISGKTTSGFSQNSRFCEENVLSSDSPNWRVCEEKLLSSEISRKTNSGFSPNWRICKENLLNGDILRKMNSGFSQNWRVCEEKLLSSEVINRTRRVSSARMKSGFLQSWCICEGNLLSSEVIDKGLKVLVKGCKNLRKIVVINASELGLLSVGEECFALQELELHKCNDNVLRGIAACQNLQVLKLVGSVEGLYNSVVSDIGLTILAQGCKRLVKLELVGCEGSFDGIKAIGQCCGMLEELVICDHRMDGGWLAALSYCENLKSLRFLSCKRIDDGPGPDEYLGSCPALERLHLQKCQLRDKKSVRAMFMVCGLVREIVIQDCWGLDNDMFSLTSACRKVTFLCLEWCSLLTTECLESVIPSWKELQSLRVVSCKNIKDSEISPALSTLFSALKDLKWRPDTKSLLSSTLVGTGMRKRGGKFFKKT